MNGRIHERLRGVHRRQIGAEWRARVAAARACSPARVAGLGLGRRRRIAGP